MEDKISERGIASSTILKALKALSKFLIHFVLIKTIPPFPIASKVVAVKKIAAISNCIGEVFSINLIYFFDNNQNCYSHIQYSEFYNVQ